MTTEVEEFEGVLVVGAGLVGSLAAISLAKQGHDVKLIEYREDFRKTKRVNDGEVEAYSEKNPIKRSINLALSHRGQEALKSVGLLEEAMKLAIPMYGRAIHLQKTEKQVTSTDDPENNHVQFLADQIQKYDEIDSNNYINSVSREDLNKLLLDALEEIPNVTLLFNCKLERVERDLTCVLKMMACDLDGSSSKTVPVQHKMIRASLLLGCDGAFSVVRRYLMRVNYSNFAQMYIPHGYKEFAIYPETRAEGSFYKLKQPNYLHIWPRGNFMLIGLPNLNKSFTCTLFAPIEALQLSNDAEIKNYFEENFSDVKKLIPDFVTQYKTNPTCRLVGVKLDDWAHVHKRGKHSVLVIGDAAHACVPFYGQGMNCGFEDVLELSLFLQKCQSEVAKGATKAHVLLEAVGEFNQKRVKDGQSCGSLSYANYQEMSDHTQSMWFLWQKKIEGILNYVLGKQFIPLYKMVTFTRIPYSEVIERNRRQQKWLQVGLVGLGCLSTIVGGYSLLFARRKLLQR